MKFIYSCIFALLVASTSLFAADDNGFTPGTETLGIGIGGLASEDVSVFNIQGSYGRFITNRLVVGPELGFHYVSSSGIVYEPAIWGRFFLMTKPPILPFIGVNCGYLYSPSYTHSTNYYVFVEASKKESDRDAELDDEFDSTLSVFRVTPQVGAYYKISQNAMLIVVGGYDINTPLDTEPEDGYELKTTTYPYISLGFSIYL